MVTLARIPAGSVTLRDARRGTERTVKLVSYEFATTTVTAKQGTNTGCNTNSRRSTTKF